MIIKRMKVKYLLLSLMGALALTASAQQPEATESQLPANRTAFEHSKGHWFISVQGGVASQFGGYNPGEKNGINFSTYMEDCLKEGGNIVPALSLGKWHNPYFATRLQLQGAYMPTPYLEQMGGEYQYFKTAFVGAHFDFMFDVVNYFSTYKPNRVFHFIPFMGLGYQFKFYEDFKEPYRHSATANAGLIFSFRLAKRVDLFLEAQAIYSNLNFTKRDATFDGEDLTPYLKGTDAYNGFAAVASLGLNFNLGQTEWNEVTPMDYELINDLNRQINSLKAENAELSKRPVSCPECPEAPEAQVVTKTILNNIVYFRIGSAKVDQNQLINIYNTAEYAKNNNEKIYVTGYADEKTGSANWNQRLSELRANAVKDILVKQYGVDESRIVVDSKGCTEQPFERNEWNRVVIMTAE